MAKSSTVPKAKKPSRTATPKRKGPARVKAEHPPGAPPALAGEFQMLLVGIKGHDLDPGQVGINILRQWHQTNEDARRYSFARGYLLGRALKAQKADLQKGQKGPWAKKIGSTLQMIGIYVRGYQAIENALEIENTFSFPEDMSFTAWVATLNSRKQAPPKSTKAPKVEHTQKRATSALASHGTRVLDDKGTATRETLDDQVKQAAKDLVEAVSPATKGKAKDVDIAQVTNSAAVLVAALAALKKLAKPKKTGRKKRPPFDPSIVKKLKPTPDTPPPEVECLEVSADDLKAGVQALTDAIPSRGRKHGPGKNFMLDLQSLPEGGQVRIVAAADGVIGRVALTGDGNPERQMISVDRRQLHSLLGSVIGDRVKLTADRTMLRTFDDLQENGVMAKALSDEQQRLLGEPFTGREVGTYEAGDLSRAILSMWKGIKSGTMLLDDGHLIAGSGPTGRGLTSPRLGTLNGSMERGAALALGKFLEPLGDRQVTLRTTKDALIAQAGVYAAISVPGTFGAADSLGYPKLFSTPASSWWEVDPSELEMALNFVASGADHGDDNITLAVNPEGGLSLSMINMESRKPVVQVVPVAASGRDEGTVVLAHPITISKLGLIQVARRGKRGNIRLEMLSIDGTNSILRVREAEVVTLLAMMPRSPQQKESQPSTSKGGPSDDQHKEGTEQERQKNLHEEVAS